MAKDAQHSQRQPRVTVLLAAHGRLPLLKQAVDSAEAQDYTGFEVLVIDDGSDESTRQWLRQAEQQYQGFRVIFQDHQGVGAARARGVEEARGELICILDSDDTLRPHALRRLTREFDAHPDCALVYTQIREMRPNGNVRLQAYSPFSTASAMLRATLIRPRVPFKHSGTMFRRDVAVELGSYDADLPCKVDIDFYLKFMCAGYRPRLVAEPLVNFRMHKDSMSRARLHGLNTWFVLIDRYGPSSLLLRTGFKAVRGISEALKKLYIEIAA